MEDNEEIVNEQEEPNWRIGKCSACEKHNVYTTFCLGTYHGNLWCGWLCNDCLELQRKINLGRLQ